ncbi:NADH:flavin oxidoreductase [Nocardioides alcanivorans]|uniref:NADH:flavin oxidoreductase n=1 Tax=Nocardioides alcanivorans TaxID=2897352 RepID=UPI001F34197D|nr:NADH:flavin oxidoreductase [Nocardioides alcanivorans]
MSIPALNEPLTFAHGPAWRNRLALAPLTNTQSNPDGTLTADEHNWLVARARGGFGQVMTAAAYVAPAGRAWEGQLGVSDDAHRPGLAKLADAIAEAGAVSAVQLHHGGRRAEANLAGSVRVGPWDDPEKQTIALSTAGVEQAVEEFVAAAVLAEEAGVHGIQVHGAHGYLLGQFLDPRSNHRTDRYGGSLTNRLRIVLEVLEGIRSATGPDFQVGIRLTPEGYGIPLTEGREHARQVLASGLVDHLDMSLWDVFMEPRRDTSGGRIIDRFVDLERGNTRLGVTGKVMTAADARWCLEQGADYVGVGLGAILHHDWATRALTQDGFTPRSLPMTPAELAAEHVGPAFVDYLSKGWDDFVAL